MYLEVKDLGNNTIKKLDIVNVFDIAKIRYDLIHQLVLWQQSHNRLAISHAKTISEVRGSTRKIYRQKGTGKARHGSIRGAQFVGGGIIFGPDKRKSYKTKINKKVKKIALLHALALKFKANAIVVHKHLKVNGSKFKDFIKMYGNEILEHKTLFIDKSFDSNFLKSVRNNYKLDILESIGVNVLDIVTHDKIFFSEESFIEISQRFRCV